MLLCIRAAVKYTETIEFPITIDMECFAFRNISTMWMEFIDARDILRQQHCRKLSLETETILSQSKNSEGFIDGSFE